MDNLLLIIITTVTTVLTLVNIFQWFDRRAKNKTLHNFLKAIHDIAKRLELLKGGREVKQKSQDICAVINAAIITVSGEKRPKKKNTIMMGHKVKKIDINNKVKRENG